MNLQGMLGSFMAGAAGGYQAGTEADWALEAEQEKQRGRMRLQQVSEEMDFQRGRRLQADKDIAQMERLRYTTENRPVKDARSSFARKASEVGMTPRELMEYENRLVKDARGVDAKTRMAAGAAIDKGFNLFLEGYDSGAVEGGLFSVDVEGVEPPTKEQWAGEKMPFEHGLYYGEDADKNGGVKQQSRSDSLFDAALARIGEEG
ncbi:MAG: hypothetical protein KZQ81_14255, partial [Candidatus Thiodiazotropha sp. (ex Rostrolucina anterorostrata)]|nr:hypothetical protein [Candidatus Thiodiazotropha sp. (ex Rostrolucina anterorostrata)]